MVTAAPLWIATMRLSMPMGPAPKMATDLPGPTRPRSFARMAMERGSSMVPTSKLTSSARGKTWPSA